jgi:uncharacterized membrane protein
MKLARQDSLALLLLLAVLIVNGVGLWPEISISRVDLNDNVYHFTLVERIVQAIDRGENPLDCWSPEWTLGYPVLRIYQPLAHLLVALIYFGLGKTVAPMTVFVWVRFLSQVLLPLSFFAAARLLGLPRLTAAAAAMLAPLVSTNFLYGIEYGSYTWAGSGLFPQAVASHLLLIALGLAFGAIRRGRRLVLTGTVLGLTFLAHLIYGYMGAVSVCLLAAMPDAETPGRVRFRRVVVVGAVALLLSLFQLAPLLLDSASINHSRWEAVWKWDSFGAGQVIAWLFTGELLDHGRLPVLTVLALAGAGVWFWSWRKRRPVAAAHAFILLGATFWTLVFFGRDFWGPLLTLMGASADMQLHRVIGGAQIFLVLLAAIALAALWRELSLRWHFTAAAAVTVILLAPMMQERAANLANNATWGRQNLEAYAAEKPALDATIATAKARGGRAYSGLAAQWGGKFKVGQVPFYAFFSEANVPAVSFLYHSMALTSDIMVRFNEWNLSHYRLFNIRTVVAPANVPGGPDVALPPFLTPIGQNGRFRVFDASGNAPGNAPGGSYFEVVDALATVKTSRRNFYDINNRWLESDWVFKRIHLLLDWHDDAPPWIPRMAPEDALSRMPALRFPGEVTREWGTGETYEAELDARRLCYALFKMTWHANWKAYVDGKPVKTAMLSPGFVGVPLTSGHHHIVCRYQPSGWKSGLAIAGWIAVMLIGGIRAFPAARAFLPAVPIPRTPALLTKMRIPVLLLLLAAPVCIPLFTSSVLWGHDGFAYFPRLVEVDQNMAHGVLVPRWAPDLGRGSGQPLFLFHPPMIYYFGELWHLFGCSFVTAMNLACATVVLASAVGMFLLARLCFGETGGWLGAAAYLYVPYFAVDLYVRSAMEEFAAFPFIALAMYGFGANARYGKRRYWLIGVAAYTGLLMCHFPAALLFTPLLLAFIALTAWLEKSWQVLVKQTFGYVLAVGLGAFIWVPALAARPYAMMNKAVEGNGLYTNHFVYLHQLWDSPWGYGLSVPGPDDGMSFALGWSHLLLIAVAGVWIWRTKLGDRPMFRFFAIAAALLSFLMLQQADWFWDLVPLLQNVQLPWRLLGPVAVCLALLVAQLGKLLEAVRMRPGSWRAAGTAAALALLIVPNLSHLHTKAMVDVDPYYWTPEQLSLRGFETTTMAEVTPKWMVALPAYTPAAARVLSGEAEIQSPARTPLYWTSKVAAKVASTVEMSTAWFPGWEARVEGQPVNAGPGTPSGLITFQVPAGEHTVQVSYGRTTTEKVAAWVSAAALILILGLVLGKGV